MKPLWPATNANVIAPTDVPAFESTSVDPPAFDPVEYAALIDMIGDDGVLELVWIFETETRDRLQRLTGGGQNAATLIREMHTLKGAAGTVAAPRLTALGRSLEQAAKQGASPGPNDLKQIEDALEAYLAAVRA